MGLIGLVCRTDRWRRSLGVFAAALALMLLSAGRAGADTAQVWPFDQSVTNSTLPAGADADDYWRMSTTACGSANLCVAGGYYEVASGNTPHAMVMPITNGIAGTAVSVPLPATANTSKSSGIDAISCQDAGSCTAIGTFTDNSTGDTLAMIDQITNGVPATAVALPAPVNAENAHSVYVDGVACPSSGACVAVGYYDISASLSAAYVLPINAGVPGTPEQVTPPGNAYQTDPAGALYGVACQANGTCTAAGGYQVGANDDMPMSVLISGGVPATGVEGLQPSSHRSTPAGAFWSLACPASGACEAVETYQDAGNAAQLMVEPIDAGTPGAASEVTIPNITNFGDLVISGSSCSSASLCVASGYYPDSSSPAQSVDLELLISPTGATDVVVPALSDAYSQATNLTSFTGVSCVASGVCLSAGLMAVGSDEFEGFEANVSAAGVASGAAESPSPAGSSTTAPSNGLYSVACGTSGSCVEVGTALSSSGAYEPFVENEQQLVLITNTGPLPAAQVGSPYSEQMTATGGWGAGGITWTVTSGNLPAGLSLNAQTGLISGTPTAAGSATVTFVATGSGTAAPSETASFLLVVAPQGPRIKLLATSRTVSGNRVPAELLCGLSTCTGEIKVQRSETVTVKKGKKRLREHRTVVLGSNSYTAAVDKIIKLEIPLNAAGKRALKGARKHRLAVTLVATVKGGASSTHSETIRLAAKTKKKKRK